jgi:8-oxo-dGTP pyrophosphatase MutT (NUDIX family)
LSKPKAKANARAKAEPKVKANSRAHARAKPKVKAKTDDHRQFAALPFRYTEDGQLQIMLLTSRETRRWVIPKGWPMRRRKPRDVAAQEAYEEAGLIGRIVGKLPIGSYHYSKQLPGRHEILCEVLVFLFRVERQLEAWPEKAQRETRWFEPSVASRLVDEGGLAEVLRRVTSAHRGPRPDSYRLLG